MNEADEQAFANGESFTITRTEPIDLEEGDMVTDPATGTTYYWQDGEIRTVGTVRKAGLTVYTDAGTFTAPPAILQPGQIAEPIVIMDTQTGRISNVEIRVLGADET